MKTHKYIPIERHKIICPKINRTMSDMVCEDCLIEKKVWTDTKWGKAYHLDCPTEILMKGNEVSERQ